jgi:hypothetical protein
LEAAVDGKGWLEGSEGRVYCTVEPRKTGPWKGRWTVLQRSYGAKLPTEQVRALGTAATKVPTP